MDHSKLHLSSLRTEVLQKERKKAIDSIMAAKRAKIISSKEKSEFRRVFNDKAQPEEACCRLLDFLFDRLEKGNGGLDLEICRLFNTIRNMISLEEEVDLCFLNQLITPKFLRLIVDFLKFGSEEQTNTELYADTVKEVIWICINLFSSSLETHEQAFIKSGLISILLDCFIKLSDLELSRDMLQAFMNFLLGQKTAVNHMRNLNFGQILWDKFHQVLDRREKIPVEWTIGLCKALTIFITAKPFDDSLASNELLVILKFGLEHADHTWGDDLIFVLGHVIGYLQQCPPIVLQRLLNCQVHRALVKLLAKMQDDSLGTLVLRCLSLLKETIDIDPLIQVISS